MATLEKKQIIKNSVLKQLLSGIEDDVSVALGVSGELLLYKNDQLIGFVDLNEKRVKMIPKQLL